MKNLEKILKGLANRRRLRIIKLLLKNKEMTVTEISEMINLSFKSTSRHLSILRHLEIVDKRQMGLNMRYYLSHPLPAVLKLILPYIPNSHE